MAVGALLASAIGFMIVFFDQGDGNLFAGNWQLKLSPALSLLIAALSIFVFLFMPIRNLGKADGFQRDLSLIAFAGGWLGAVSAFPVWAVLYAGGFVPPPHAFGIFGIAYVSMLLSSLYAHWRL
jgi:hypothetical protein